LVGWALLVVWAGVLGLPRDCNGCLAWSMWLCVGFERGATWLSTARWVG
jgi:hypothetical protein